MDEVIADFLPKLLSIYNKTFGERVTKQDLAGTKLWRLHPHRAAQISAIIDDPGFFRDLAVIRDSQAVIRALLERYEIYIVTAAMEHPTSFNAKYAWLKEHFPFLSDRNFVFCGDKSIILADYMIDDNTYNLVGFQGQGLLYTAPHNLNEIGFVRVNNWQEVKSYLLGRP